MKMMILPKTMRMFNATPIKLPIVLGTGGSQF
jgi:hypothetical protein